MHWHGICHTLSNKMDGAVHITQNVIAMGEIFVYDFFVQDAIYGASKGFTIRS